MNFVDPIRDRKKIAQIKNLLRGQIRRRPSPPWRWLRPGFLSGLSRGSGLRFTFGGKTAAIAAPTTDGVAFQPAWEVWTWEGEVPLSGRWFYAKASGSGLTLLYSYTPGEG